MEIDDDVTQYAEDSPIWDGDGVKRGRNAPPDTKYWKFNSADKA